MTNEQKDAKITALEEAGERLLTAYESLMPGLANIAVQDYAIINEAPIKMRQAINL